MVVPDEAYISSYSSYLNVNDENQLTLEIEPSFAQNYRAEWTSSNESVATVSEDGLVVARNPGTVTISVKVYLGGSSDDLSDFLTDSISITVRGTRLEKIEIEGANIREIIANETLQLTAVFSPTNVINKNVTWESSNPAVATVSANGLVSYVGLGTTKIKVISAADSTKTDTITINAVAERLVQTLDIEGQATRTINQDQSLKLTAVISPDNATNKNVLWESSNPAVATVDTNGLVTYVSPGTATIQATSAANPAKSDTVVIHTIKTGTYNISFKYRNVDGNTPEILTLDDKTSTNISITSSDVRLEQGVAIIKFNNFSIVDENNYYVVEENRDIKTEYFEDDTWITDVEFNTSVTAKNNVAIILVLDKSRSISDSDFSKIKDFARSFIDIINANNPTAKVGLVSFSNYSQIDTIGVNQLDANTGYRTTQIGDLKKHITDMTKGEFTALYSAIDKAYGLIPNYSVYDGCAIVSFTDGIDNNSMITLDNLVDKLETPANLKSFSIGFGDVKDSELTALAVNGAYRKATNINDLQTLFDSFSKAVSTFHDLTLRRPSGIVADWVEMKLTITAITK